MQSRRIRQATQERRCTWYEDDHKTNHAATIAGVLQKTDANGRKYYVIKLSKPIESDMIRVGFTRYGAYRSIQSPR